MMVDPLELVSVAEIADAAGVTRQCVSQWGTRDLGFPAPVAHLALGPVYLWPDVAAWLAETERMTTPTGQNVRRPYGPYDRLGPELEQVDGFVATGLELSDACKVVASHARHGGGATRLAHQLRHLYPGWKQRERLNAAAPPG